MRVQTGVPTCCWWECTMAWLLWRTLVWSPQRFEWETSPPRLLHLNTGSSVGGAVWGSCASLLEKECNRGGLEALELRLTSCSPHLPLLPV